MSRENYYQVALAKEKDIPYLLATALGRPGDCTVNRWSWARLLKAMKVDLHLPVYQAVPEGCIDSELRALIFEAEHNNENGDSIIIHECTPAYVWFDTSYLAITISRSEAGVTLALEDHVLDGQAPIWVLAELVKLGVLAAVVPLYQAARFAVLVEEEPKD